MSRTDVHAPAWVKDRDPAWRREYREEHDHDNGVCNLAAWVADRNTPYAGTCHLTYVGGRNIYCGCSMCTGQIGRKFSRRRERARWLIVRQRLLAAAPGDRGDVDTHVPDGSAW
jgi:hypothetical protein